MTAAARIACVVIILAVAYIATEPALRVAAQRRRNRRLRVHNQRTCPLCAQKRSRQKALDQLEDAFWKSGRP